MSNISASDVKELRERTGAGMMECKKALVESNGDMEAAIEAMRTSGTVKAAKKAGRVTAEGLVGIQIDSVAQTAAIVEVNCETDFVARDDNFKAFVKKVTETALAHKTKEIEVLSLSTISETGQTVEEARQTLITQIGENVQLRRVALLPSTGTIGTYVHNGRIGALVAITTKNDALAKDLAMHVAAANPQALNPEDISKELLDQEKTIFLAQSIESGKPPEIAEKMVEGRLKKFMAEISFTQQPFVKDPSQTIEQLLKADNAQIQQYIRFEVGEGIEKVKEDFAEAVKAVQTTQV